MMPRMAELVRLRTLVEDDLPQLHRWYQTAELWDHLVGAFQPRTEAESVAYMRRWLTPSRIERRLAIVGGDDGSLLGLTALSPIEPEAGEAEFHIFLGETQARGRGYGRAATAAMLAHAFDDLGLWRVRLKVLRTNEPALRLYAELGFEPHGDADETVEKRGARVAVVAMGVTDAVYRQRQASYAARSATR
jgi:RimJ/RimL family protein N-acetyltransferase